MTAELQRLLGRIEATQDLILQELKDQRRKIDAVQSKMYIWQGGFAVAFIVWTFMQESVARALGLK